MAIGNGLLDEVLNIQSLANFLYYHGLVSEKWVPLVTFIIKFKPMHKFRSWKFLQQECRSINSTYDPWEALTDPKFNQTLCQNLVNPFF